MATSFALKWNNGGKQRRTAQIPVAAWEAHEPIIRELYKHKTLPELMDIMKTDHNFEATARQYTFRLGQWGLHKQGAGKDTQTEDRTPRKTPGNASENPEQVLQISCSPTSDDLKRPRSGQSIASRSSQYSTEQATTSKKAKPTPEESTSDVGGLWSADESLSVLSHSPFSEDSRSIVSSMSSAKMSTSQSVSLDARSGQDIDLSKRHSYKLFPVSTNESSSSPSGVNGPGFYFRSQSSSPVGPLEPCTPQLQEDPPALPEQSPHSPPLIAPMKKLFAGSITLEFCLETAQKLEDFPNLSTGFKIPKEAENRLRLVADSLFAAGHLDAASNMYSVLLVAEESETAQRTQLHTEALPMLTPRLIAAARSARTPRQCQLVETVLLKRLGSFENQDICAAEKFLVHAFLKDVYAQHGETTASLHHSKLCWFYAHLVSEQGDPALKRDGSIVFYIYYKLIHPEIPSSGVIDTAVIKDTSSRPGLLAPHGSTEIGHDDFMEFCMLTRDPAQTDVVSRKREVDWMLCISKCVRDCVTWCESIIDNNDLNLDMHLTYDFGFIWRARYQEISSFGCDLPWMTISENQLGIRATEHIRTCTIIVYVMRKRNLATFSDLTLVSVYLGILYDLTPLRMGNISPRSSHASILAPSLGSSNSSLRSFARVARSMKQRVTEGSSGGVRMSYYSRLSGRISRQSDMSQLSDLFGSVSIHEEDETET